MEPTPDLLAEQVANSSNDRESVIEEDASETQKGLPVGMKLVFSQKIVLVTVTVDAAPDPLLKIALPWPLAEFWLNVQL